MTEPDPTPSLIQQRFALRRARTHAVWMIVGSLIGALIIGISVVVGEGGWRLWSGIATVAVFIGGVMFGVAKLLAARRATREFEDRYGRDAGIQD
ncbi:hypothetical protein [Microbacterium sp. 1.5R]|uniref:hypothetical protein n=1 Tax=Microbacterium sp. 1.5R TaxID=1916917 RepID=UPI0011A662FD|nr:hypothetical protein [Microbacterium sp. 1.5R]